MHPLQFRTAVRRVAKDKLFSIINILGLTIGISACLLIWLIAHYELSFDRFHPDRDRIYRAVSRRQFPGTEVVNLGRISFGAAHAVHQSFAGLDQIASFYSYNVSVSVPAVAQPNTPRFAPGKNWDMIIAEPAWFSIFPYDWLAGSPSTSLNKPFMVVLAASKARKYFGSIPYGQMIGRQLTYDDLLPLTVSGIVADRDRHTDLAFTDFISFATIGPSFLRDHVGFDDPNKPDSWSERNYAQTYIKLKDGVSAVSFDRFIAGVIHSHARQAEMKGKLGITLEPLTSLHFDARYEDLYSRKAHLPTLYILMGTSLFILILAVINFINLSTAQAFARAREVGTRKVLGSGRTGIISQFLSETAFLVLIAVALSPLMLWWAFRAFPEFVPPGLTYAELWSPASLLFITGTAVVTLLLAGLYPAFVLSSLAPVLSLQGRVTGSGTGSSSLRQSLTVFQFSIALFFIVATLVVGRQLRYMLHKDLGFRQENIVNVSLWGLDYKLYPKRPREVFADKVRRLPGVEDVSSNRFDPAEYREITWDIKDRSSGTKLDLPARDADDRYIPLFGLNILSGRNLRVPKVDTETEILLSEKAAIELGYNHPEDAIGRQMAVNNLTGPVVGILADFYTESLQMPLKPVFIFASPYEAVNVSVRMTPGSGRPNNAVLAGIEKLFKESFPNNDFNYWIFKEQMEGLYSDEQRMSTIVNVSMIIMILISCMGLFGLAAFTAGRRTKEIGIRKVLGATVIGIVALLARRFAFLVLVAFMVATPVAWYFLHQWLHNYANRITIQWWEFAIAGFGAIAIALLTIGYHSVRAARINPVESLRLE